MQAENPEKEVETAKEDFLHELKFQYQTELELRTTLDSKANNMITVCGSIITVAIGIATFLVSKISSTYFLIPALISLGAGIVFAALAMRSFIKSYSLRKYRFAMGDDVFFDDKTGRYKEDQAKRFINAKKQIFAEHMTKEYLESIRQNKKMNQEKADSIKDGQKGLSRSILIVAGLVVYAVIVVTSFSSF